MLMILAVLAILVLALLILIWRGFVLSYLWLWFMVPLGLPEVSLGESVGLILIARVLTFALSPNDDKEKEWYEKLLIWFLAPLIALGIGYGIHHFM